MIRKNDRCVVCKKGVLRGRLVQCHYCIRLYHLNCLDPPIRDWDHSMRWICPAHENFFVSHLMFLLLIIIVYTNACLFAYFSIIGISLS